jgi:methionyl-tRNA formyltransferase
MKKMYSVILCGYRDWAIRINEYVASMKEVNCIHFIKTKEEYDRIIPTISFLDIDFILFVGWSWMVDENVLKECLCLGIHPSDLPKYRGGSPIQHQIINGLKNTKITLMSLSHKKVDAGDIYAKEDVSLMGNNMDIVFENIIRSSKQMMTNFISNYSKVRPRKQVLENGSYYKRRTPRESRLTIEKMSAMTLEQIYNFVRALTDPYPNAYIEDDNGNKLILKQVEYIPKG